MKNCKDMSLVACRAFILITLLTTSAISSGTQSGSYYTSVTFGQGALFPNGNYCFNFLENGYLQIIPPWLGAIYAVVKQDQLDTDTHGWQAVSTLRESSTVTPKIVFMLHGATRASQHQSDKLNSQRSEISGNGIITTDTAPYQDGESTPWVFSGYLVEDCFPSY